MTVQDFEAAILALAAWREANEGDSVDAMLCIAYTIYNLSQKKELGIGDAIVQHQAIHGVEVDNDLYPHPSDPRFTRLLQKAADVGTQFGEDLTNGALHYINLAQVGGLSQELEEVMENPGEHSVCAVAFGRHFYK